jgi:energy-coupling factor transporter ATP-binding protein EcfA2
MIIGITGAKGSGKTLVMTMMAAILEKEGKKILSNYRLKIPHTLISQDIIKNYSDKDTPLHDCVLLLDEIHILMDCRTSFKNTIITYFLLQSRKRDVDIYWTSQNFGQPEKRLRENTDYIIECDGHYDREHKNLLYVVIKIIKYYGKNQFREISTKLVRNPERFYCLYNTYEIIDFNKEKK